MFDLLTITLTLPIYVSDAIFSGIYVAAFLKPKHSIKLIHILWTTIYLSVEVVLYKVMDTQTVAFRTLLDLTLLYLLELLFFERDFKRQTFAAISFTAGKELIRNIGSVGYYLVCRKPLKHSRSGGTRLRNLR